MNARFTLDGSDELEQHLTRICEAVRAGVLQITSPAKLEGLLLGGGYGRGEGGVLRTPQGDLPYNDLDFHVCLRGNLLLDEAVYGPNLKALQQPLGQQAGVEVEFKMFSLPKLQRSKITMFSYDLVMGHRWLVGSDDLLPGCEHHRAANQIPLSEANRLLMNRCSGLLFARERLSARPFTPFHADFVGRNLAKAQLAFGDVVLTALGKYHWSCRDRHQQLLDLKDNAGIPWLDEIREHHASGVEFKLHPHRSQSSAGDLEALHHRLADLGLHVWLWLEEQRLRQPFASAREYALSRLNKCPETSAWKNLLVNARRLGPSSVLGLRAARYPRERLLTALALLLWEPAALKDPGLLRRVQVDLRTAARRHSDLVAAYQNLWEHFC